MMDQHRDPATPGSWVLPQRQVEGGTEQAQHVCQLSQGGGGAEETKAERAPPPPAGREPILAGKAAWTWTWTGMAVSGAAG